MNSQLKQTIKNVIFLWGAISLGLIVSILLYLRISSLYHNNERPPKLKESLHEKTFGDIGLSIIGNYDNKEPQILINITQKNNKIVENYLLPTHEKGFDYVRFNDSLISPAGPGKYRIMLFTVADECDNSSNQVWFLSYDGHMKFIRLDNLFNMRRPKSGNGPIFGNKHLRFPYIGEIDNRLYVIPVEINANDAITIAPLLNNRGTALLRTDFEHDVAYISAELKKFPDQSSTEAARNRSFMSYDKFIKKFNDVQLDFKEALQGSSISW